MNEQKSIAKEYGVLQILVGVVLICVAIGIANAANENAEGYCSLTASKVFNACKFEAKEDAKVGIANCLNITDADEREACEMEVSLALDEDWESCGDVNQARLEVCDLVGEARYDPQLDPADFVDPLTIGTSTAVNPYMPLTPGLVKVFQSEGETVTVTVTSETIEIMGITAIIVTDVVEEEGELIEVTDDYYAQDIYGNVWYMGEYVLNYEDDKITDLDGSFLAGVDYAKAGILMKAAPQVGDVFRQEWYLDEAEDVVQILDLNASESVPAVDCDGNCVQTRDWTALEPDSNENKFLLPGYGVILAYDVAEPEIREELVEIIFP